MTPETRSLLRAAAVGDSETVKSLIAQGIDVNCVSAAGQTPLMLAAGFGHEVIVKVLLDAGAFVGAADELGLTAIEWSANSPKISNLIKEAGAPLGFQQLDRSNGQPKLTPSTAAYKLQAGNKPRFEPPPTEARVTLGGLAGAILREKAAKTAHLEEPHQDEISEILPPPAPPPKATVETRVADEPIEVESGSETRFEYEPVEGSAGVERVFDHVEEAAPDISGFEFEQPLEEVPGEIPAVVERKFDHVEQAAPDTAGFESEQRLEEVPVEIPVERELDDVEQAAPDIAGFESEQRFAEVPEEVAPVDEHRFDVQEAAPDITQDTEEESEPVPNQYFPIRAVGPVTQRRFEQIQGNDWDRIQATVEDNWAEPLLPTERLPEREVEEGVELPYEGQSPPKKAEPIVEYPFDGENLFESFPKTDDDTLARANIPASDDTAPAARRSQEAFQSLGLSEPPPARVSKVQVNVPSFKTSSSTRTLIWILVILFLGGGAYAGYRLSSYFLNSNNPPTTTTITPKAEPQPNLAPVKAAPVVSGELAGTELFVPDATHPAEAAAESGTVVVRVRVNQKGIVLSAEAAEGPDSLRRAAEQAGKQAAFSPEKLRGLGQVIGGTITYTFVPPTTNTASSQPTATSTGETETHPPQVGGPLAGTELDVPQPDYPSAAKSRNVSGTVTIVVRVNRSGRVVSWRTLHGENLLRPAALRAAKSASFDPDKLPGKGDVVGTITFTFTRR